MDSWVPGAAGSLWDVDNLPYGIFSRPGGRRQVGVRVSDHVLDLTGLASRQHLDLADALDAPVLNPLMACSRDQHSGLRSWLRRALVDPAWQTEVAPYLLPLEELELHLPFDVADYVDFYASEHHATNVGRLFRPDQPPLLPNWKHLPVAYHGRAGTIVPSGTGIRRPSGQRRGEGAPDFGPSTRLDIEAELGFVVGAPSRAGAPVPMRDFHAHAFGVVGVNDWSARDIQAWEYVPLGPFLGKSFATSISHWVTPLAALEAAWVPMPRQDPRPLPYLEPDSALALDIAIEVELNGHVVSRPPYRSMYWSPAQMLAHLTVNGASVRTGDLFASGTVSGAAPGEEGSFLELSRGWTEPFGPESRLSLEDGDTVVLRYTAPGVEGGRIALGEVAGTVLPALERPV
ncbi:fumarylacetoacetase [Nocardioides alcanivorans]|uniref:fumarylacetoacetase n=1 Tax=Nocardioides alcanivorans TaxID=2897352 RepID=UPI001F1A3611|nr:fumarylacetoacetase [Nocardioides alcanivorans]